MFILRQGKHLLLIVLLLSLCKNISAQSTVEDGNVMVVVSISKYKTAMEPFVEWKNKKGIETRLFEYPLETGGEGAEKLKEFLYDLYNDEGAVYFLLVGDAGDIPSLTAGGGHSDISYVMFTGDDHYPDAFIGRFSVESAEQAAAMATKVITYESKPDSTGTWYTRGMGMGSNEGSPPDYMWIEDMTEDMLAGSFTEVTHIFQGQGGTLEDIKNTVNNGISWFNYMGHGSRTSFGFTDVLVSSSTFLEFTNNNMPFVMISSAANNGAFTDTCIAETATRLPVSGALVYVGSCLSISFPLYLEPGHSEMVRLAANDSCLSMGAIHCKGIHKILDKNSSGMYLNSALTWIYFGDPSVMLFTKTPEPLAVNHPFNVAPGIQEFSVVLSEPVYGRIGLYSDYNGFLGNQLLSGDSIATIKIVVQNTDRVIHLTVTGLNKLPYMKEIRVGPSHYIEVTRPDGGEEWKTGQPYDITWQSNYSPDVKIELLKDYVYHSTIASSAPGNGSFSWILPDTITPGNDYKVCITSNDIEAVSDQSAGPFSIDHISAVQKVSEISIKFFGLFVHPNPINKQCDGAVTFSLKTDRKITKGNLNVFDPLGNGIFQSDFSNATIRSYGTIGVWDFSNSNLRAVARGSYLVVVSYTDNEGAKVIIKKVLGIK